MIEKKIKEMLSEQEWTFEDIQNMSKMVNIFVDKIVEGMTWEEKVTRIWDNIPILNVNELGEPMHLTFGSYLEHMLKTSLLTEVAEIMKIELMNANVNFNYQKEVEIDEVSKGSVGRKSPKKGKTTSKKNSNE
tara:strand:+ start:834 stop:1232 length:399 start_codon:yes stop_codon:yes gene_type:complete